MRCSNCGKDVPFGGKVCPWCHADKSADQAQKVLSMVCGMSGGFLGYAIHGIIFGFFGLVIGAIVGMVIATRMQKK